MISKLAALTIRSTAGRMRVSRDSKACWGESVPVRPFRFFDFTFHRYHRADPAHSSPIEKRSHSNDGPSIQAQRSLTDNRVVRFFVARTLSFFSIFPATVTSLKSKLPARVFRSGHIVRLSFPSPQVEFFPLQLLLRGIWSAQSLRSLPVRLYCRWLSGGGLGKWDWPIGAVTA